MQAIDWKEQALQLQSTGHLEDALPLMLKSVALRENSHTLCLSLSELADLYLEMLKFSNAEEAARRMLTEAHRYDTLGQTRIASEILADIEKEKKTGLEHGTTVRLCHLANRAELNGKIGIVRGKRRNTNQFYVDVEDRRLLVHPKNISWQMQPCHSNHGAKEAWD
jgi:hypothetical protein